MDKYRATRLTLQGEAALASLTEFHPSPQARETDITRVHDASYVRAFIEGELSPGVMRAIGFPWTPSVVLRNLASVGGTVEALRAVLNQPELRITAHISGAVQC